METMNIIPFQKLDLKYNGDISLLKNGDFVAHLYATANEPGLRETLMISEGIIIVAENSCNVGVLGSLLLTHMHIILL